MMYTGPYNTISTAFTAQPVLALLFIVPAYLNAQAAHQATYVPPTFVTTTTQSPQQQFVLPQNLNHPTMPAPYYHPFQQYLYPTSYMDNTFLTMKQIRLEFAIFRRGDPMGWLNKAEQYIDLY